MSWPIHHLPVLQNWDCHSCGGCCRSHRVHVTEEERERIARQDWQNDPALAGLPLLIRDGTWWAAQYRLNQRPDGSCVFLNEQGRCKIHERYGSEAKPLACRLYPFILVPAGNHWRIGLRFSCPSVAQNKGQLLTAHERDLVDYAAELERREPVDQRKLLPPALQIRQSVEWPDLLIFVQALQSLLKNDADRIERRWRKCLALAQLCKQARFEEVRGARLEEFLNLAVANIDSEVPGHLAAVAHPSWVGRVLFRQALAVLIRKDAGQDRGPATRSRLALLVSAMRFASGKGPVPRLHALIADKTFEQLEEPIGPLPDAAEEILERYYLVKVESLQFCGPANFGLSFWAGLESLALTLPAILWLVRAFAGLPREEAVIRALTIVDHNFGYSPHLGSRWQRLALRLLAQRGELEKLIGWYSR